MDKFCCNIGGRVDFLPRLVSFAHCRRADFVRQPVERQSKGDGLRQPCPVLMRSFCVCLRLASSSVVLACCTLTSCDKKKRFDRIAYLLLHSSFVFCESSCASIACSRISIPCHRDVAVLNRFGHAGGPRDKTLRRMQIRCVDKDVAPQRKFDLQGSGEIAYRTIDAKFCQNVL